MAHIIPDPASEGDLSSLQIEDFWDKHGKTVIAVAVLVVLAAIGGAIFITVQHNEELAAQTAFAQATDEASLQAVIEKYPKSVTAFNASVLLAQDQKNAGKYADADATLKAAMTKFQDNPLVGLASLGLAANRAAQNQTQQYAEALQQTATAYSTSFVAPYALYSEAEVAISQGKTGDAASILRNLTTQYPESVSSRQAAESLEKIESLADTESKN